jgi:hypothetical protein
VEIKLDTIFKETIFLVANNCDFFGIIDLRMAQDFSSLNSQFLAEAPVFSKKAPVFSEIAPSFSEIVPSFYLDTLTK